MSCRRVPAALSCWLLLLWTLSWFAFQASGQFSTTQVTLANPATGNIPVSCFTQASSTTSAQACRTISFCLTNNNRGGFAVTRTPTDVVGLTMYFLSVVLSLGPVSVAPGAETVPWNLASQYVTILSGTVVSSNGTCVRVALPQLPLLDVPRGVRYTLAFDLSAPQLYARQQSGVPTNGTLSFQVGIVFSDVPSQLLSLGPLSLAHVAVAALSVWAPYPAVIPEAVLSIAVATQSCMQPSVRQVAVSLSRWALSLWGGVDKSHGVLLWRAAIVMFVPLALHLAGFVLVHVGFTSGRRRKHCSDDDGGRAPSGGAGGGGGYSAIVAAIPWATSCQMSRFPWLSASWVELWLAPLCFQAVVVLMQDTVDDGVARVGYVLLAVATVLAVVAWCAVPAVVLRYLPDLFRPLKERSAGTVLAHLPALLRMVLPSKTWGPLSYAAVWNQPFLACREQCLRYANATWGCTLLVLLLLGYKPATARPCVGLQVVAGLVVLIAAAVLLWLRPFRSKLLSVLLAVEYVVLAAVLMASASRARETPPPGVGIDLGVQSLLVMLHVVGMLRGVATLAAAVAERFLVCPLVWPSYERIDTVVDLMKRSAPEFPLLDEHQADVELVEVAPSMQGAGVQPERLSGVTRRESRYGPSLEEAPRSTTDRGCRSDAGVPDARCGTESLAAGGSDDGDDSGDDDFFEQCRRRREQASFALGLPSSLDQRSSEACRAGSRDESVVSPVCSSSSSSWTLSVLQRSRWHRPRRESTSTGLVQLAASEQSKTLLRQPMERLIQEKGLVPLSIARHRRLEEDGL